MGVTVVAENEEEAKRILNDTLDSITVKEIREKISNRSEVEINNSNIITELRKKNMEREVER